jgi:hypothetical protein
MYQLTLLESYSYILVYVKMSEIPSKKMNALFAQIDISLIKSFFINLLNFLDILFMLLYDETDEYMYQLTFIPVN